MLKCNVHKCPSRCHQIFDHSKIRCMTVLKQKCSKGHNQSWYCHSGAAPSTCATCERGRREAERKAQKLLREKQKRQEEDEKHSRELAKIQDEIDRIAEELKDNKHKQEQTAALAQKKADLIAAKALSNKNSATPPPAHVAANNSTTDSSSPDTADEAHSSLKKHPVSGQGRSIDKKALATHIKSAVAHNKSPAKTEWQRLKDQENAVNPAIDDIMEMTGLEDVKQSILTIRSKVELAIRQGTDLKKERLGLVLLGNPGTGRLMLHFVSCRY
jgi:predicted ribosome quality control (RQC) complex YloA/Tae2 family protein